MMINSRDTTSHDKDIIMTNSNHDPQSATKATTTSTTNINYSAKTILLKFGLLPDYRCIQQSEELLENFLEKNQNNTDVNGSSGSRCETNVPSTSKSSSLLLLPPLDAETRQQITILHSYFSNFCHPPPSIESIVFIFLLEQRRAIVVSSSHLQIARRKKSQDKELFTHSTTTTTTSRTTTTTTTTPTTATNEAAPKNKIQYQLPKEAMIHTSSNSAQFIISLLRTNPKTCLLKLPLEFQLSFFRILTRLMTSEGDAEYDEECLFDWSFLENSMSNRDEEEESPLSSSSLSSCVHNDPVEEADKGVPSNDDDDDDSYDLVRKLSIISDKERTSSFPSHDQKVMNRNRTTSSTSQTSFSNTSGGSRPFNSGKVFEAWSFGKWKKKKSAPLYSIIRFCSNPCWNDELIKTSNSRRRSRKWSFVADNVKLGKEEENALRNEDINSGSDDENDEDIPTYRADDDRTIGTFIRAYHDILDNCLEHNAIDSNGQYLLLGPVAQLIAIICATRVSVKNLRLLLVLIEDTSQKNPRRSILNLSCLHILRALRFAAEYSIQCNGVLDKAGPPSFFSFGKGEQSGGLTATFPMPWPFKYDFAMACWFRAETFYCKEGDDRHVVLFCATSETGARIEVSLEAHSIEMTARDTSAATLIVTVLDSAGNTVVGANIPRKVRLVGCVLSPTVWYHVAVRLTRPRLGRFSLASFSGKDEVSIFLNGKLMLKENIKMPQCAVSKSGEKGGIGSLSGIGGFGPFSFNEPSTMSFALSFFPCFDGQAGALFVFKEYVSDESICALHHETSASKEQNSSSLFGSFVDRWDTSQEKLNSLAKAVTSASMHSDVEDVILPNYTMFIGENSPRQNNAFDLAEADGADSELIPIGLSRVLFGSKLFIVWNPCRVTNGVVLDPHLSAHVNMAGRASTWTFESIRDSMESLGGLPRIIPLFGILNNVLPWEDCPSPLGVLHDYPNMLAPSLLFLVSSMIRDHQANACELYRCGAIHVVEKCLHDCKTRDTEEGFYRIGVSLFVAKYTASALLELWQASRPNFALETTVFSKLVINIPLLFGGVANAKGVSFHAVMLPILSEITMTNPDKVRDCIDINGIFDVVHQYSSGKEVEEEVDGDHFFHGPTLSPGDECFVVDVLLGMVAVMLSHNCPSEDLSRLITFITYNLDLEWESNSAAINSSLDRSARRSGRYRSTVKAVSILFFLLQQTRVPNLMNCLGDIFDDGNCVASWMLCCLVNSFDDRIRGLGIKCLAAYLRITSLTGALDASSASGYSTKNIHNTLNSMLSGVFNGRVNTKIIYKLLWHLLKCHRERLGSASNAALMYLILDDEPEGSSSILLSDIVCQSSGKVGGFRLRIGSFDMQATKVDPRQSIRNSFGVSTVLRLLRFLSNDQKERWLFDILALLLGSPKSVSIVLSCDDWQPVLFQLVAEVLDEIYGDESETGNGQSGPTVCTETLSRPSVRTRYDLSLKLYSTLLGHCVRKGDDQSYDSVEMAASLQRCHANGSTIFTILLSHLFADLIEKGTIASVEIACKNSEPRGRNHALKQSARLVTKSIMSNGAEGIDMPSAVKQWRCLRYLTALTVAVITECGFGVFQLFDYASANASATDYITGGIYGIRLDNLVSGVNAFEALAGAKLSADCSERHKRDRYKYVSVVLASQMLTLLDAFIFPDNVDSQASELHGLTLVRSSEPRVGQSHGTLVASLVRLSLVLIAYLEPTSVKFLQACSRLRCFLHWVLEIVRESVTLGGYAHAFHELTAPLDRLVLAVVLQCHRALSRCSAVLLEMECDWEKYFVDIESMKKSRRRLFRSILEIREIILAAYRGRSEVLQESLSPVAFETLSQGFEEEQGIGATIQPTKIPPKEAFLRAFLKSDWVVGFHDVMSEGELNIPEQISCDQINKGKKSSTRGKRAIEELATESDSIIKEYNILLNAPFTLYCEKQRKWAETDAVRDREYTGDLLVKRLSSMHRSERLDFSKSVAARMFLTSQRFLSLEKLSHDPWKRQRHWTFSSHTDLLYRRIVLHPNYNFDDHCSASYELSLGKERGTIQRDEEATERRQEKARKEREKAEAVLRAAIVPYIDTVDDDAEDEDIDNSDDDGFLGWDNDGNGDRFDESLERAQDKDGFIPDEKSSENAADESWDQVEPIDLKESSELNPYAWARKFMWAEGERFVHSFESVVLVSIQDTRGGTLILTSHSIYFLQTGDTMDVMTKEKKDEADKQDKKWKLNSLTDIHGRRYMLKAQAVEMFFANMEGKSTAHLFTKLSFSFPHLPEFHGSTNSAGLFLTFDGVKDRDLFHSKLVGSCKVPLLRISKTLNPRVVFKKSKLTELWRKRKISNFQYIMALNLIAGRTFNDITQYPVFPWVLADYTSDTLDLTDQRVYRDLTKPVGALNPDRLTQLIERFHDLDGFPESEKFLYGSHYSSPGVVLHYLIRQEPYTSMHIALQSGRFDCPDRLFVDIAGCWRSCNSSTSDVKELIPEFFTSPEIFSNTNCFPLGKTQAKMSVDNVKLPPWAKGSPHEFIRLHRLALESEYVSNNLHHWIDLIFGYKQRGPAALAAHNVFHYLSYEGSVDIDKVQDEVERKAIEGHIQNFGQTPSQLLSKQPHPCRSEQQDEVIHLFENICLESMRCDTPEKQFGGSNNYSIISMHTRGELVIVIHSDFTVCTYKLRDADPFHFKLEKAKTIDSKGAAKVIGSGDNDEGRYIMNASFAIALVANSRLTGKSNSSSEPSHVLVSCGYFNDSIKVHTLDSLQLQCSLHGCHRGKINCLEVGGEGETLVTGGDDATCRIWIIDHDTLALAITDGFVKSSLCQDRYDQNKCYHVHTLLGHVTPVSCVAICTKLDVVVSGALGGSVCIHKVRSGKFIRSFHFDASLKEVLESSGAGNGIPVRKLSIHVNGSFLVHLSDGSLHHISVNGEQLCRAHIGERLNAMMICTKSETVITGGEMGCVRIWALHDFSLLCTVDVKKHGPITSLALTRGVPQFLCVGSSNGLTSIVSKIPNR